MRIIKHTAVASAVISTLLGTTPAVRAQSIDNEVFTRTLAADLVNREVAFYEHKPASQPTAVAEAPADVAEVTLTVVSRSSLPVPAMNLSSEASNAQVTLRVDSRTRLAVSAVDWTSGASDAQVLQRAATEVVLNETPVLTPEIVPASSQQVVSNTARNAAPSRYVVISNVEFEGNEAVSDATLKAVAQPFVGKRIGLSDLEELRIQLTQAYVDRGYLNSGAILPDQKVEAGNIVYEIVEGDISRVNIDGDGDLLEKYISERLLNGAAAPFNSFALQENFQLLLDDPLIDRMDGQLQALPESGQSALNLKVVRGRPYDVSLSASNHGALSLGSQQVLLSGVRRNITGVGDEIGATFGGNQNKYNVVAYYEIPLDIDETRLRAEVTFADSTVVEEPFDTVDIQSQTNGFDIAVSKDLKRNVNNKLTVGSGFSLRENSNTLAGEPFSFSSGEIDGKSRVAAARLWQELIRRGDESVLAVRTTLNMGLDMFGSTINAEDLPGSEFLTLQGQVQYSRKVLNNGSQLLLRADAQLADSQLLSLERFSVGGANSVRGYRENELVRDQALFASAELRYPILTSDKYGNFQLAPFIDVGSGSNKGFFSDSERLSSVGLGVLWNFRQHLASELYIGVPLRDLESSDGNSLQERGVHLQVIATF